jgi:putative endopeptidase
MVELIDYLKKSLQFTSIILHGCLLQQRKSNEKLNKFTVKVAYPDKWKDYSKLEIIPEAKGGTSIQQPSEYW